MNRFIAYFDYLGFKEFIENNDLKYQKEIIINSFRDMEIAIGNGNYKETTSGFTADNSQSKINCLNFSDTIVFWTNNDSDEYLKEFLEVSYSFNWRAILYEFPVRGALVCDEIEYIGFKESNSIGGSYNVNSIFGKGLVKAHLKANAQEWAGTVLEESFIYEIKKRGYSPEEFLLPYAKKYKVPYKNGESISEEYVLRLVKGALNEEALKNYANGISENFAAHKKTINDLRVKSKLDNTIKFLKSFYAENE